MLPVYDISSYPDHHPGGLEILLEVAGTDATENFDYVGHSSVAEETLRGFEIGDLAGYVWTPSLPLEKGMNG